MAQFILATLIEKNTKIGIPASRITWINVSPNAGSTSIWLISNDPGDETEEGVFYVKETVEELVLAINA